MATNVRVALGDRSYDIAIDRGNLARAPTFLAERRKCTHAIVITDDRVSPLYAAPLAESLQAAGVRATLLTVPAGESSKCVHQAERLWNELSAAKTDRKSIVVALGGGVIGDLAGFVAATYARGLSFFQIPTTLLAQVDSSVGGKVGINLPTAKNIVGAFWQPAGVLIDLDVLRTLPNREFVSGLAEVVKYGVILDAPFFAFLEKNVSGILRRDSEALETIVARCCQLKASVVEQDEREESGLRAVLNYGHTFCHAIETITHYERFLHGEAVAVGMVYASRLAELVGRIGGDVTSRQIALLRALGLPTHASALDATCLLDAMQRDKKSEHGRLKFVLPSELGKVQLVGDVPAAVARQAIESIHAEQKESRP